MKYGRSAGSAKIPCVIVLSALLALVKPNMGNAAEQAATVLSVSPSVASHLGGKATTLEVKMKVPVAATVISDAAGRAQFMFPDTTTVSIAPGTEIALAEFVDDPNEESIILNMAQGTARFITGDVSRRKPSAMIVNTPQASVGIRGTMVTIVVSGDTTRVYLTETSGKGVSVTNRSTGEQLQMVKPGRLIEITPRGMKEREGTLEEVRKMTVDLHTAPRITDDERRVPVAVASITPQGGLSPTGAYDAGINPVPYLDGLNENLLVGHYAGSGPNNASVYFDVNAMAKISNAGFTVFNAQGNDFIGTNGSGSIQSGGSFNAGNFALSGNGISGPSSATMSGQFDSASSGSWQVSGSTNGGVNTFNGSGTFSKQ